MKRILNTCSIVVPLCANCTVTLTNYRGPGRSLYNVMLFSRIWFVVDNISRCPIEPWDPLLYFLFSFAEISIFTKSSSRDSFILSYKILTSVLSKARPFPHSLFWKVYFCHLQPQLAWGTHHFERGIFSLAATISLRMIMLHIYDSKGCWLTLQFLALRLYLYI